MPHLVLSRSHQRLFVVPITDEAVRSSSCRASHADQYTFPGASIPLFFRASGSLAPTLCRKGLITHFSGRSDEVSSVRPTEKYPTVHMPMSNAAHEAQDGEGHPKALLHLTLDGLLPPNQILVVNPSIRAATLISLTPNGEKHVIAQEHFSPYGMLVLVPLLQAYPHYCPYEVLHASLSSLSLDEAHKQLQDMREIAIRPVRRAINSLIVGLRALGLQVHSIRSEGYLIKARSRRRA
jgi:hypothetical protein